MALSYEYSVGSVRAREKSLFTHADIEQLLACKSAKELCSVLSDKGYGSGSTVDEIIQDHTERVWKYLKEVAPDFSIFDPFIIQNDVHNFKVVLKGIMADREYKDLLLSPCTIKEEDLKKSVEHRSFSALPEWLRKPCGEAYELLAHTGDARASDAVLDSAAMKRMLELTEGSGFLQEYFETLVFMCNIKIAIRASRAGASKDYLIKALCEVRGFGKSQVIEATLKGTPALLELLSKCGEYDCKTAVEEYKKSPSAFERFVDNKLIKMAKECCKRASEGAEPLIGYYLGSEAEKKVVHIISSGIKTNTDKEIIRERLREIYG